MTTPFLISGAFDSTAPDFNLQSPSTVQPGSQTRQYTPADPIGAIDLSTLRAGIAPYWAWVVSFVPTDLVNTTGSVVLLLQNGTQQDLLDFPGAAQPDACWNVLLPQGSKISAIVDDGGGSAIGDLYFTLTGVAADDWYRLQCCHKFAPLPSGGAPPP